MTEAGVYATPQAQPSTVELEALLSLPRLGRFLPLIVDGWPPRWRGILRPRSEALSASEPPRPCCLELAQRADWLSPTAPSVSLESRLCASDVCLSSPYVKSIASSSAPAFVSSFSFLMTVVLSGGRLGSSMRLSSTRSPTELSPELGDPALLLCSWSSVAPLTAVLDGKSCGCQLPPFLRNIQSSIVFTSPPPSISRSPTSLGFPSIVPWNFASSEVLLCLFFSAVLDVSPMPGP